MTFTAAVQSSIPTIVYIVAVMAVISLVEALVPLHARGRWGRAHLLPNFALTAITFATNAFFNAALVLALIAAEADGSGLLRLLALPAPFALAIAVVLLDFSFYVAHVCMHKMPAFWRFHSVHHSDPHLDVTTTVRQHPGEGVIRYAFLTTAAVALGVSPAGFALYRTWSALNGLLEHANIRVPRRLDTALARVVVTPNMHKVHHSRRPSETDSNYGNIFSLFDRVLGTFTPTERGLNIAYGLDGLDTPAVQTTAALLALPFRGAGDPADAGLSRTAV